MSCDAAASLFLFFAASHPLPHAGAHFIQAADAVATAIPDSVAGEPMFADIVARASGLKSTVESYRTALKTAPDQIFDLSGFKAQVEDLSARNEAGSQELRKRGGDSDLKCILHGIAQDLPVRLSQLEKATDAAARDSALREMSYLLNDNVEVITTPPSLPPVL